MKYTIESIRKYLKKAKDLEKVYAAKKPEEIKMTISTGNRKIGHALNVSLLPIKTCANCKECKYLCYDIKACIAYPSCFDARVRNTVLLKKDRDLFFKKIDQKCARRRKDKFFRWHVAGDIVDYDYFERMIKVAENHPDFIFWTYTKNYAVVNSYVANNGNDRKKAVPSNLVIMFSEWRGMPLDNPYNFPVFTVRFKDEDEKQFRKIHNVKFKCPGNCDICKATKHGCPYGESSYCDEH